MKIQPPVQEVKGNPLVGFAVFVLLILGLTFAAVYFFYFQGAGKTATLTLQNFAGSVEISRNGKNWEKPRRSSAIKPFTYLRTSAAAEADLKFGENAVMRLKENSFLLFMPPSVFSKSKGRIHLTQGNLLVSNLNSPLEITFSESRKNAPRIFFEDLSTKTITGSGTAGGLYLVSADPGKKTVGVHVLRGDITVTPLFKKGSALVLHEMESTVKSSTADFAKLKIAEKDWKATQETYELVERSLKEEAAQQALSKKAGNFFSYVIDDGTFYQKKLGWCERSFVAPEDKSPVYLETTYDVFPTGAWVGLYLKTRDFDISKFKTFKLDARRIPGRPHPELIRIEFKAKYQVVQAFVIKMLHTEWETIEFPLRISKPTNINEMTVIISNDKVGSAKSGGFQFRNFTVVDADKKPLSIAANTKEASASSSFDPRIADVAQNTTAITKKILPPSAQKPAVKPLIQKAAATVSKAADTAEEKAKVLADDFSDEAETF